MNAVERLKAAITKLEGLQKRYFIHSGWLCELDPYGEVVGLTNDELIVTLHRTIDAQLDILHGALESAEDSPRGWPQFSGDRRDLKLADAILGGKSAVVT